MMRYLLFTGHMIDAEDRRDARFPPSKESAVKEAMNRGMAEIKQTYPHDITGIAGGACGGDILFHELCLELGIPSEVYLALPPEEFKQASVSFAGKAWEERYERLLQSLPVHVLSPVDATVNVWEKANEWMLQASLKSGGDQMTLLALWDGKRGDGSGGTEHMIDVAKEKGAQTKIIDITSL